MAPEIFPRAALGRVADFIFFPLRTVVLNEKTVERVGLTSLQQERIRAVWPHLSGKLLDIGAGNNRLVRLYKNGVGVDVYDAGGGATILTDTANLPFESGCFDTVSLVACLNHIPKREEVLAEAYRVLKSGGRCVVTMINPWIGYWNHLLCWYEESHERGMAPGERDGLWQHEMLALLTQAGFHVEAVRPFLYRLNALYIASKP